MSRGAIVWVWPLLLVGVPAWGGDVFRCPDGKGGVVWRDVPCTITPEALAAPSAPPPTTPTPQVEPPRPPATPRPAPAARATSERTVGKCLATRSAKAQVQRADQLAVELLWEAPVQNACLQPASGLVTFTAYGSRNLVLVSDSVKIVMAPQGAETVQGIVRVTQQQMRQMRRYDAKVTE